MEIDDEADGRWEGNLGNGAVQERLMLLVSEDELEGASLIGCSAIRFGLSFRV